MDLFQPYNGLSIQNSITSQSRNRNQIDQGNVYQYGLDQLKNLDKNLDN